MPTWAVHFIAIYWIGTRALVPPPCDRIALGDKWLPPWRATPPRRVTRPGGRPRAPPRRLSWNRVSTGLLFLPVNSSTLITSPLHHVSSAMASSRLKCCAYYCSKQPSRTVLHSKKEISNQMQQKSSHRSKKKSKCWVNFSYIVFKMSS